MSKVSPIIISIILSLTVVALAITRCTTISDKEVTSTKDSVLSDSHLVLTGPKILVKDHTLNFGRVTTEDTLSYHLVYTNTGTTPLLLTKVRSNCGCTVVSYRADPLLPGESDSVFIEMDTKHLGEFNKVVAIYSNAVNDYDSTINSSRILVNLSWIVIKKE